MSRQVNYIVLTLTEDKLSRTKTFLTEEHKDWYDWLLEHESNYGLTMEDWTPFGGDSGSIKSLVENREDTATEMTSQSDFLYEDSSLQEMVFDFLEAEVHVIFLDPLVLLSRERKDFLLRIMSRVAYGDHCVCCTIWPDGVSTTRNKIENNPYHKCDKPPLHLNNTLENIRVYEEKGRKHRTITNLIEFRNFINHTFIPYSLLQQNEGSEIFPQDRPRNRPKI